jgi:magnesium-transporting ATPase (P-type)
MVTMTKSDPGRNSKESPWHSLSIQDTLQQLDGLATGLIASGVADRLAQHGRNEITRRKPISPWRLLFKQFAN